ncbi:MAG: GEVED domain-containing protein [Cytophagales bacterium]|nr:GEVED domain-containing protein [Cytophagales bacterium]
MKVLFCPIQILGNELVLKSLLTMFFVHFTFLSFSQNAVFEKIEKLKVTSNFQHYNLFNQAKGTILNNVPQVESGMNLNDQVLAEISKTRPNVMSFDLPIDTHKGARVDLIINDLYSNRYSVVDSKGNQFKLENSISYVGVIQSEKESLVSINISEGIISGFVSNKKGDFEIVAISGTNKYELSPFKMSDLTPYECAVSDDLTFVTDVGQTVFKTANSEIVETINCRPLEIYFEADYSIFQAKGSIQGVATYVNNLFSQVAAIYENEGIEITISQIKVWDSQDPYFNINSPQYILNNFSSTIQANFLGDIAHFLSFKGPRAGIAFTDVLNNKQSSFSVSTGLSSEVVPFPSYSASVTIVTHEIGHNIGSPHTHNCSWPGGPIDNCSPIEGNCSPGPTPLNGGTIMSYCHTAEGIGVNFSLGFGALPGELIRNKVAGFIGNNVSPYNFVASNITKDQAYLEWNYNYPNSRFYVEFRPQGQSTWNVVEVSNTWINLKDLQPNTQYEIKVRTNCSDYAVNSFLTNSDDGYCMAQYGSKSCGLGFDTPLSSVILDNSVLSKNSGCNSKNYTLFKNTGKELKIGETYNFSLELYHEFQASIWIDLNGDKEFGVDELMYEGGIGEHTGVIEGSFIIPLGVTPRNSVRLRVVTNLLDAPLFPCGQYWLGEVEDYEINLIDCVSQTSVPTNLISSNNFGGAIDLTWASNTSGPFSIQYKSEDSYEWQRAWVSENSLHLDGLQPLTNYDWSVKTICSIDSDISSFSVPKSEYCEYKRLAESGCNYTIALDRVVLGGTELSNSSGCSASDYTFFDNPKKELQSGQEYEFILERTGYFNSAQAAIWVDINLNGIFEDEEQLFVTTEPQFNAITGNIKIPFNIEYPVETRMRVMLQFGVKPTNPCWATSVLWPVTGEVEDYIVRLKPCSPNNLSSPESALVKNIYDRGAVLTWVAVSNEVYQIDVKKKGSSIWKYAGESEGNSFHLEKLNPMTEYEWRVRKACSINYLNGSFSTRAETNFCEIPYTLLDACTGRIAIDGFKVNDYSLSEGSGCSSENYSFFPYKTANLEGGKSYSFTLNVLDQTKLFQAGIWIDLNNNGYFEETERVFVTTNISSGNISGIFTIPLGVEPNESVRLRIILTTQHEIRILPCRSYQLGETEDYLVNIVPCTSNNLIAPSNAISENVYDTGVLLSWEHESTGPFELKYKSNHDVEWNKILIESGTSYHLSSLEPNLSYNWRIQAYCSNNFADKSFKTKPLNTYCDVAYQRECNLYNHAVINSVSIDNTFLSTSSGCKSGAYEFFPYVSKTLNVGRAYTFSINMLNPNDSFWGAYIWLDFNGNEVFEENEMLYGSNQRNIGVISGEFTIPNGVQTVLATRLRVTTQLFYEDNPLSPCSVTGSGYPGETEDYLINIYNACPSEIVLSNPSDNILSNNRVFQASKLIGKIKASNLISGNSSVIYRSKVIELDPGFKVGDQAVFKAEIGGCD